MKMQRISGYRAGETRIAADCGRVLEMVGWTAVNKGTGKVGKVKLSNEKRKGPKSK